MEKLLALNVIRPPILVISYHDHFHCYNDGDDCDDDDDDDDDDASI